jgi:hypothetical protein
MNEKFEAKSVRPLVDYYDHIAPLLKGEGGGDLINWEPRGLPPTLTPDLRDYLATAEMRWSKAPNGAPVDAVLDLRSDSETQTTKIYPSLLMVARAVNHIRSTGESITIITPSSANKATALRRAVELAISAELVDADHLRIISVVPKVALPKFRSSRLVEDRELYALNPLFVFESPNPSDVKKIVQEAMRQYSDRRVARRGERVWQTLKLDNYAAADAARAIFENYVAPPRKDRVHAHAVSSAYGLIGYGRQRARLVQRGQMGHRAGYLLVQHMFTSDMVRDITGESTPSYEEAADGVLRQNSSPHWPQETDDKSENMEATFYTKQPPTIEEMRALARDYFGTGIVVSKRECLDSYESTRDGLRAIDITLPDDPSDLREWAAVMGWTGCQHARLRGLLPPDSELVLHCSGTYSRGDYKPLSSEDWTEVTGPAAVVESLVSGTRTA